MTPSDATPAVPTNEPTLAGERVRLRPLRRDDEPSLREILAEPGVAKWWGTLSAEEAAEELFDPDERWFAIELDGTLVGAIGYGEVMTPDYRHASIDLFICGEHQGRGIGTDALRTLAGYLFDVRGHHRLTIDPATANERAIRAYGRVGFRPVGVMRAYERGRDGTWHDGLLMDLLAGELT